MHGLLFPYPDFARLSSFQRHLADIHSHTLEEAQGSIDDFIA